MERLPRANEAVIPPRKLTEYLLSESHPVGSSKAMFFRGLGFGDASIQVFKEALLEIVRRSDIVEVIPSSHGTKFVIDGEIETPLGGVAAVRTIWIVESDQGRPRFVTAYPK